MPASFTASAPGRVNLIGDHTDYTGGLVMPMILEQQTVITGTTSAEASWELVSEDDPVPALISLPVTDPSAVQPPWARYVAGVLAVFHERGIQVPGFSGSVTTTLPLGSGLSSSAALEVAVARLIVQLIGDQVETIDSIELAKLCQRAEHIATGVPCGIMDQLSIISGRAHTATMIDCHDLSIDYVTLPSEIEFSVRFIHHRTLADSAYAERVSECQRIENIIGPLRLATLDALKSSSSSSSSSPQLSEHLHRRARHIISENQRVRDFAAALGAGRFIEAGRLMIESHWSLSRDYETSTAEMDQALNACLAEPGVLGARMTGGGFGGCLVIMRHR